MRVKTGVDVLADGAAHPWLTDGARIGLVTNPTGITADFVSTVDVCAGLVDAKLTALFACEHGLSGELQAGIPFQTRNIPVMTFRYTACTAYIKSRSLTCWLMWIRFF